LIYIKKIIYKKIKLKLKKYDNVLFISIKLPVKLIPSVKSLINCYHCSSCQL
jgi:hypothetical protein